MGIHKSPDYYKMVVCLLEHDEFNRNDIYKFLKILLYVLKCIIKINFLLIEKIKN